MEKAGPGVQAAAADEPEPSRVTRNPSHTHPRPLLNLSAPAGLNPVHSFGQHGPGISGFARLGAGHWGQREVQTSPVCEEHPVQGGYRPIITAFRRQLIGEGGLYKHRGPAPALRRPTSSLLVSRHFGH